MAADVPAVEYLATTRIGEKGQLTVPKQYRDDLKLEKGAPVAVLRIGDGLILIPEQPWLRRLGESIGALLESHDLGAAELQATLPEARDRVFARHYPRLAAKPSANPKQRMKRR